MCLKPPSLNRHLSSSSCGQRSLGLSWSIARRGVCAQITCRKLVLRVLVVTQGENLKLQQNKNCAVKTKVN